MQASENWHLATAPRQVHSLLNWLTSATWTRRAPRLPTQWWLERHWTVVIRLCSPDEERAYRSYSPHHGDAASSISCRFSNFH